MADFIVQAHRELAEGIRRAVRVLRWRSGLYGEDYPLIPVGAGAEWSLDEQSWFSLPADRSLSIRRDPIVQPTAEPQTPALFLTARDAVEERVRGLGLGADDYLVKPFAFSELLARVCTVLRHGPAREADVLRIADLEIDFPQHRVHRGSRRIDLTPKEFAPALGPGGRRGDGRITK